MMLHRPSLAVQYFYIFIIFIMWCIIVSHQENFNYREMEIIDDLPVKDDLEKYLSALEKIVYFADGHRFYVDLNMCFGIYMINANLRNIVQSRGHYLSFQKQVRMMHVVKTSDDIIGHYIKVSYQESVDDNSNVLVKLLNFYSNRTIIWPNITEKFNTKLLKKTKFYSRKSLETVYFKWPRYVKNVFKFKKGHPTPEESDHCLNLLSQNPIRSKENFRHCQVPYSCLKLVLKGSDYGYGIAHRLLFMLAAKYWRNCVITTVPDDQRIIDNHCSKIYNELEYNAYHEFGIPDLFMEDVTLCSIEGNAQFLRRSWIDELLDFQTQDGCFNLTRPSEESATATIATDQVTKAKLMHKTDWDKICNSHITGVASGMLASAIRLIMENYY